MWNADEALVGFQIVGTTRASCDAHNQRVKLNVLQRSSLETETNYDHQHQNQRRSSEQGARLRSSMKPALLHRT